MQSSNFSDTVSIKALLLTFVAYVITSVVAFAILVIAWLPSGIPADQAARMAETAPSVVTGELLIGAILGIAAGWLVCHLSGAIGLKNCLVLGFIFMAYAVLGVFLHPLAPLWKHGLHLIAPIPVSLAGGFLRLRFGRKHAPVGLS